MSKGVAIFCQGDQFSAWILQGVFVLCAGFVRVDFPLNCPAHWRRGFTVGLGNSSVLDGCSNAGPVWVIISLIVFYFRLIYYKAGAEV